MNLIDMIRIWRCWEKLKKITKKGDTMLNWKTTTLGILTILAGLANAGINYLNGKDVNIPILLAAITAGWGLIHSTDSTTSAANTAAIAKNAKAITKISGIVLLVLMLSFAAVPAQAQSLPVNIYAGGVSFAVGASSSSVAGTGLYARLVSNDSGTYAFTAVDAVPVTRSPFVVTTNFGVGVAQKIITIGKVNFFTPTSAGISYTGSNTGWSWTTGVLANIPIKGSWSLMPNCRLVKSSVSGGTGYQPIIGVLTAWGK